LVGSLSYSSAACTFLTSKSIIYRTLCMFRTIGDPHSSQYLQSSSRTGERLQTSSHPRPLISATYKNNTYQSPLRILYRIRHFSLYYSECHTLHMLLVRSLRVLEYVAVLINFPLNSQNVLRRLSFPQVKLVLSEAGRTEGVAETGPRLRFGGL